MASAEPGSGEAAEAAEAGCEVMPCDRTEQSQRLALEELIGTEASYVHNLQLCVCDIRAHLRDKQVTRATPAQGLRGESAQSCEMPKSLQGLLPPSCAPPHQPASGLGWTWV